MRNFEYIKYYPPFIAFNIILLLKYDWIFLLFDMQNKVQNIFNESFIEDYLITLLTASNINVNDFHHSLLSKNN